MFSGHIRFVESYFVDDLLRRWHANPRSVGSDLLRSSLPTARTFTPSFWPTLCALIADCRWLLRPRIPANYWRLSLGSLIHVAVISHSLDDEPGRGTRMLREMRSLRPQIKGVILLDTSKPQQVLDCFRAGARGIFSKQERLENLCKCIRNVHEGQSGRAASIWITRSKLWPTLPSSEQAIAKESNCSPRENGRSSSTSPEA